MEKDIMLTLKDINFRQSTGIKRGFTDDKGIKYPRRCKLLSAYLHNNTVVKYTREKWIELKEKQMNPLLFTLMTATPSINNDEYQQEENKKSHS